MGGVFGQADFMICVPTNMHNSLSLSTPLWPLALINLRNVQRTCECYRMTNVTTLTTAVGSTSLSLTTNVDIDFTRPLVSYKM